MADAKKAKGDDGDLKADPKKPGAPAPDGEAPAAEGAEGEAPPSKFGKKKIILFALVPILILAGGARGRAPRAVRAGRSPASRRAAPPVP